MKFLFLLLLPNLVFANTNNDPIDLSKNKCTTYRPAIGVLKANKKMDLHQLIKVWETLPVSRLNVTLPNTQFKIKMTNDSCAQKMKDSILKTLSRRKQRIKLEDQAFKKEEEFYKKHFNGVRPRSNQKQRIKSQIELENSRQLIKAGEYNLQLVLKRKNDAEFQRDHEQVKEAFQRVTDFMKDGDDTLLIPDSCPLKLEVNLSANSFAKCICFNSGPCKAYSQEEHSNLTPEANGTSSD